MGPLLQSCSSQLSLPDSEWEKAHHPISVSSSNYSEVQVCQSGNYSFLKMWWKAPDQEASCRQWLDHIRKWCGEDLRVIMCCNTRQHKYSHNTTALSLQLPLWKSGGSQSQKYLLDLSAYLSYGRHEVDNADYLQKAKAMYPERGPQYSSADKLGYSLLIFQVNVWQVWPNFCFCVPSVF